MIEGKSIIGYSTIGEGTVLLKARAADTNKELPEKFVAASESEVDAAVKLATDAAPIFAKTHPEDRARFLEIIADEIEGLGDALLERASLESGLPVPRFQGERGRTCGQLRLFAQVVREGSWVDASIDLPDADRAPLPKPDVRKMLTGIGPVLVFTASNFPLAFSTAGGDTASALAAGCPVIVKAHEAHLGVNAMVAKCIQTAAQKVGMPDGVFSSLNGNGFETGSRLINHAGIKSVAFTGSFKGGMALYQMAQQRTEPIPVFAEMGSINPVVLCPFALKEKGQSLAKTYADSIVLGVGQFCTNPGLMMGIASPELEKFKGELTKCLQQVPDGTMLTEGISESYKTGKHKILDQQEVTCSTELSKSATLMTTSAQTFIGNPALHQEVFGPMSLLVECANEDELLKVIASLEGQLTGTIMASEADRGLAKLVSRSLQDKVGRIIWNGAPTGVEVCHSMHHGGPFPATTDSRFTSVGTSAIQRFARPLCYQDFPQDLLPAELRDENPMGIVRKVNGVVQLKVIQ